MQKWCGKIGKKEEVRKRDVSLGQTSGLWLATPLTLKIEFSLGNQIKKKKSDH